MTLGGDWIRWVCWNAAAKIKSWLLYKRQTQQPPCLFPWDNLCHLGLCQWGHLHQRLVLDQSPELPKPRAKNNIFLYESGLPRVFCHMDESFVYYLNFCCYCCLDIFLLMFKDEIPELSVPNVSRFRKWCLFPFQSEWTFGFLKYRLLSQLPYKFI